MATNHSQQHLSPSASSALAVATGDTSSQEVETERNSDHSGHTDTTAGGKREETGEGGGGGGGGAVKRIKLARSGAAGGGSHGDQSTREFLASRARSVAQPEPASDDARNEEAAKLSESASKDDAWHRHGNAVNHTPFSEERITECGAEDGVPVRKRLSIAEMKAEM